MSTKVYYAYRMKASRWGDFCRLLYDSHLHRSAAYIRSQMGGQAKFISGLETLMKSNYRRLMFGQHTELECNLTVNLVPSQNFVVCVPFSDVNLYGFRPDHRLYPEYGYWNNTDRPKDLSAREWRRRERFWEAKLGDWDWFPMLKVFDASRCEDAARLFETAYPRSSKRKMWEVGRMAAEIERKLRVPVSTK